MDTSQISDEINKVVKKIENKVAEETKKEIVKKITNVINFSKQQMETYIAESMQKEFQEFYGTTFSSNILKQLYSISIVNLRPEISYQAENINIFKSNLDIEGLLDDMDDFIVDAEESENENYYDEELYNEYYGDEGNIEVEYNYVSNKKMNWKPTYYNKNFRAGEVPKVEDAFKIAKENSIKNFQSEEMPKLKAYSKKEIGINIF